MDTTEVRTRSRRFIDRIGKCIEHSLGVLCRQVVYIQRVTNGEGSRMLRIV